MSALCLQAAVTDVISSGSEVPKATMVSPIKRSDMPKYFAMAVAELTVSWLPPTIAAPPKIM